MLQLCLVTVGVTELIECSRLDQLFYTNDRRKLTPGSVLGPLQDEMGKTRQNKARQDDDGGGGGGGGDSGGDNDCGNDKYD